ncbi:CocE/NonD family hydrolase C-terminal non-catalytic domain-containing protein, partial [Burkholderia cenocepacia]|uniref:CocE/NonD family hydrolase C-terminal non-catalytic domain-containing protein n=1 Tax=Burkholderia cenocepacia TaxID=95486 RepID=UPI0024B68DD0
DAWTAEVNRWFTRYLIGYDNGVEQDPRAVIAQADGTLLKEADWAARRATPVTYFAGGDGAGTGTLLRPPLARFTDDARIPALTLANTPTGENRSRFETAPLTAATRISGTATAHVRLTFTGVANVTALLVD